jgi:hypothetical protein
MRMARQQRGPSIAIGPLNHCGQASYWANAIVRELGIKAFSFAASGPLSRHIPKANMKGLAHHSVPHSRLSPEWYRGYRISRALRHCTHVLAESFLPLPGNHVLGFIAHGSELRDPDAHMARYEYSYFRVASDEWVNRLRALTALNRARLSDHLTFVTTPDLLLDAPGATWLPLAIDVASWRSDSGVLQRQVPVVLHLPSRREPPIKGTQYVDETLRRLHEAGRIEYLSPKAVPHSKMRQLVWRADVVVDQILTGSYGVAAIEAMSAGRLVVGCVLEEVRSLMPESPPIIDATPETFGVVMDQLLDDRARHRVAAANGVGFCQRWHEGRASVDALAAFLDLDSSANSHKGGTKEVR